MSRFIEGWYVIYTRPFHEKKVAGILSEKGVNNFLPTEKKIRVWNDRKKWVEAPLFPSYLFVYLQNIQHYYQGMDTEGALNYVRMGKQIAKVDESLVNNLQVITRREQELQVTSYLFQPGRKLIIREGALIGLSCELVEYKGCRKALVRVDLLQRSILLTLPATYLMAV